MWRWSVSSVGVERGGCAGYRVEGGLGVDRQAGQAVQVSGQQRAVLVSQPMTSARPPPADDPRRAGAPGPRSAMLRARTSPWRGRRSRTASHHRVLSRSGWSGVEEGEQLGRGDGPGARTCAARSDRVLTGTQFAHDGVSDHADVAFHIMRVLACPDPRHGAAAARAVLRRLDTPRRDGLPRRFRSTTLRACGAGRLALEQNPSARISTALGEPPNVRTRMSSRLQKLSAVPLYKLDAVMCTDLGGQHTCAIGR